MRILSPPPCREFREETGVTPVGPFLRSASVKQKAGKTIHAWAWEGDADPDCTTSNTTRTEWPRDTGTWGSSSPRSIAVRGSRQRSLARS